jgi:hypothetical protein
LKDGDLNAAAGRNQHTHACSWSIRSVVLRSRESP